MSITFACGQCGKSFTVDDKLAGKTGRCKQCGAIMTIPAEGPAAPPADDVFGLDEPVLPPRAAAPPAPPRAAAPDPLAPPSRSKLKKKGPLAVVGTVFKVILAVFGGLFAIGFVFGILSGIFPGLQKISTPGFKTKAELQAIYQKQIDLHDELAAIFAAVQDPDQAKAASPKAVRKIDEIAANLVEMKAVKARQVDVNALKEEYGNRSKEAAQRMLGQMMRITQIPDAMAALDVQAAFDRLEAVENSIPGREQVQVPGAPNIPAQSVATQGQGEDPNPGAGSPPAGRPQGGPKAPQKLMTRAALESLLKKRVSYHDDLARLMAEVQDEAQAKRNSRRTAAKVRQIVANLRQIKVAKAAKPDIEALGAQYAAPQQEAVDRVVVERTRLEQLPDLWAAFGIQAAFSELAQEESGLPGAESANPADGAAPPDAEAGPEAPSGTDPDQARAIANDRARRAGNRAGPRSPARPGPR